MMRVATLFCSYHIMTSFPASITDQTTAKCYLFVKQLFFRMKCMVSNMFKIANISRPTLIFVWPGHKSLGKPSCKLAFQLTTILRPVSTQDNFPQGKNGQKGFFCNKITRANKLMSWWQRKLSNPFLSVGKLSWVETGLYAHPRMTKALNLSGETHGLSLWTSEDSIWYYNILFRFFRWSSWTVQKIKDACPWLPRSFAHSYDWFRVYNE